MNERFLRKDNSDGDKIERLLNATNLDPEALSAISDETKALLLIEKMRNKGIWHRELIDAITERYPSKQVKKAIKKLIYFLSQKGVLVEHGEIQEILAPKVVRLRDLTRMPIKKAYSTVPLGVYRLRLGCYFYTKSNCLYLFLSPIGGIKKALLIGKDDFDGFYRREKKQFITIPPDHALLTLKMAYANSSPKELEAIEEKISFLIESITDIQITLNSVYYRHIDIEDLNGVEEFDEIEFVTTLGEVLIDHDLISEYASKYKETVTPKIIVGDNIIREKVESLLDELLDKLLEEKSKEEILFAIKEEILFSKYLKKPIRKELFALTVAFERGHRSVLKRALELLLRAIRRREQLESPIITP